MSTPRVEVFTGAKFLALPAKAKRRKDELGVYELRLLKELVDYCESGQSLNDRVNVEGVVYRKASYILVNKGLAAYVKNTLYPSPKMKTVFIPILDRIPADKHIHSRLCNAYEEFLSSVS